MTEPTYIVGIDLGTTNSVVAYTEARLETDVEPRIRIFEIPQLVGPGSMENLTTLPSFVLLPGPHDVPEGALRVPWSGDETMAVGPFRQGSGRRNPPSPGCLRQIVALSYRGGPQQKDPSLGRSG